MMKRKRRAVLTAVLIVLAACLCSCGSGGKKAADVFGRKIAALEECMFPGGDAAAPISYDTDKYGYIAFISVCDGGQRASVYHAGGKAPEEAFRAAAERAEKYIRAKGYEARWVKADIVTGLRTVAAEDFESIIGSYTRKYMREGIAYDGGFACAFLEEEINGSTLISYDNKKINENNTKAYLKTRGEEGLFSGIPDELILFTAAGYFCDEDFNVYTLLTEEKDYGRREKAPVDAALAGSLAAGAMERLKGMVVDGGEFIYGYRGTTGEILPGYNILRHAGTVWCMINQYAMTGDESLVPLIGKLLEYLEGCVEYRTPSIAYVVEQDTGEIKLGGNALALLAYIAYTETFASDLYVELCGGLAEGILSLMDETKGTYYHVLNFPGFTEKEEFRTVYYDGEATYALARMYGLSKQEKYLSAAESAIDNFIRANYEQYRDHWVEYSVNEVTKHNPDGRYLAFGLLNANVNLRRIYRLDPDSGTSFELLMAAFEIYDRVMEGHRGLAYLSEFDRQGFFDTVAYRANHMLNAYFFPECAMYMAAPAEVVDAFYVRQDHFRVRIDDIQHAVGGYHRYIINYDKINKYSDIDK